MRNVLKSLLAGSIVVISLLVLLEGGGRIVMHVRYGVPGKSYGRWRADPVLGSRMAENVYDHRLRTNGLGFRGDEAVRREHPSGAWRILVYGGSTTLCWNLRTPETWPARLENRLRGESGNPRHQVLNAGDILWSVGRIYARARTEVPALHPDFVILMSGANEVPNAVLLEKTGTRMEDLVRQGRYGVFSRRLPQDSWLAQNSLAYRVLYRILLVPAAKMLRTETDRTWTRLLLTDIGPEHPPIPPDPYILSNFLHVVRETIELCRAAGAEPLYVVEANARHSVGLDHFTSYSRAGADLARTLGVQVIDAQAMVDGWPGDPMLHFYDSGLHYAASGADLLADRIFQEALAPRLGGGSRH